MSESPAPRESSIFRPLAALPRGPHRLTREEVAASQRERLLAAIVKLVAEKGYVGATITETARRAGVSPNVFYEHFASKEECLLAAYDVFASELLARVNDELARDVERNEYLTAAARAYLGTLDTERDAARAFLLEMDAAGGESRARRHEAFAAFAATIRRRHEQMQADDASLGPLPERTYLGLGLGVRALVCDALEDPAQPPLTDLVPDVVQWITAAFLGAAAATAELERYDERRRSA